MSSVRLSGMLLLPVVILVSFFAVSFMCHDAVAVEAVYHGGQIGLASPVCYGDTGEVSKDGLKTNCGGGVVEEPSGSGSLVPSEKPSLIGGSSEASEPIQQTPVITDDEVRGTGSSSRDDAVVAVVVCVALGLAVVGSSTVLLVKRRKE